MNELQFQVEINAPKQRVWDTLWQDKTFREWASIVDPGTHMVGELIEGNEVQFISGNGYGVTSLVKKLIPEEYLMLLHSADTQDAGEQERDKQWTGGKEIYKLEELNNVTTLRFECDVPEELVTIMNDRYPKALRRVKELAERNL